jgi:hypothetical protein
VLEVRVADDGVEVLVGEGQRHGVEVDLPGEDAAPGGALRADAGDVGPDDLRAAVAQELRQEARPAPGLEQTLAGDAAMIMRRRSKSTSPGSSRQ